MLQSIFLVSIWALGKAEGDQPEWCKDKPPPQNRFLCTNSWCKSVDAETAVLFCRKTCNFCAEKYNEECKKTKPCPKGLYCVGGKCNSLRGEGCVDLEPDRCAQIPLSILSTECKKISWFSRNCAKTCGICTCSAADEGKCTQEWTGTVCDRGSCKDANALALATTNTLETCATFKNHGFLVGDEYDETQSADATTQATYQTDCSKKSAVIPTPVNGGWCKDEPISGAPCTNSWCESVGVQLSVLYCRKTCNFCAEKHNKECKKNPDCPKGLYCVGGKCNSLGVDGCVDLLPANCKLRKEQMGLSPSSPYCKINDFTKDCAKTCGICTCSAADEGKCAKEYPGTVCDRGSCKDANALALATTDTLDNKLLRRE